MNTSSKMPGVRGLLANSAPAELLAPLLRHDGDAGLVRTIWCLTRRLGLTDAEEDTLVSFSQTLTDGYMPQHQK